MGRGRRDRHVEPEHVRLCGPRVVLEPCEQPGRNAGEQNGVEVGSRVRRVPCVSGKVRERAGYKTLRSAAKLGWS